MPVLPNASFPVTEVAAADSRSAQEHFEHLLSFETDCWDVHAAITAGRVDFVLLDVRSADRGAARLACLGRKVKKMIGGIEGWKNEGFSLETGQQKN